MVEAGAAAVRSDRGAPAFIKETGTKVYFAMEKSAVVLFLP